MYIEMYIHVNIFIKKIFCNSFMLSLQSIQFTNSSQPWVYKSMNAIG